MAELKAGAPPPLLEEFIDKLESSEIVRIKRAVNKGYRLFLAERSSNQESWLASKYSCSGRASQRPVRSLPLYPTEMRSLVPGSMGTWPSYLPIKRGSKFTLVMPTNLTIQRVLLFHMGEQIIAIPQNMIPSIVPAEATKAKTVVGDTPLMEHVNNIIPVYNLSKLIGAD